MSKVANFSARGELHDDLLSVTLAAAAKDVQTVTADGKPTHELTEGVLIRDLPSQTDDRGTLMEMFDPLWNWHPDPFSYAHMITIRPGIVKGWNLHKQHDDRYCILAGEMLLVLFDPRPLSSTYGEICKIILSETNRRLVSVPKLVWHADHNIGTKDVVLVNFPTRHYDHADPDKYRLPIDTDLIPYSFGGARGW